MCGYDRVLVEPSGIYDVDEFFDVLREEPLDQWYEIGNVIAILDARLEDNLSEQADYLLASEAANAGKVILSHADAAAREQCEDTVAHLNRALEQIRCDPENRPQEGYLTEKSHGSDKRRFRGSIQMRLSSGKLPQDGFREWAELRLFIFHGRED